MRQSRPVFIVQSPGTQAMLVKASDRTEHTHRQLRATHFHRKYRDWQAAVDRDIFTDVDRECGLAHRWTARNDDQVARLQPGRHSIEIHETGGHTGDVVLVVPIIEFVDAFNDLCQQRLNFLETLCAARALFGNRKNLGLGFIQHLLDFLALRIECLTGDFICHSNQLAQHATVTHDFRVAADVGCRWRVLGQRIQIRQTANVICLAGAAERFEDGDHVRWPGIVDQLDNVLKNDAMIVAIEIVFADKVGNAIPSCVIKKQTTQYGLFGLDRMRRHTEGFELRVRTVIHGAHYTSRPLQPALDKREY